MKMFNFGSVRKLLILASLSIGLAIFAATSSQAEEIDLGNVTTFDSSLEVPLDDSEGVAGDLAEFHDAAEEEDDGYADEVNVSRWEEVESLQEGYSVVGFDRDAFYASVNAEVLRHPEFPVGTGFEGAELVFLYTSLAGLEYYSNHYSVEIEAGHLVIESFLEGSTAIPESGFNGGEGLGGVCTGGFPAHFGTVPGIISARHCVDDAINPVAPIAYDGNIFQTFAYPDNFADIAFAGLLIEPSGLVRTSPNKLEPMYFMQHPLKGQSACHYGIGTGYSCSSIMTVIPNYISGSTHLSGLVVLQGYVSDPYDSGGPWFSSTIQKNAMGIHYGKVYVNGAWRSAFTDIYEVITFGVSPVLEANSIYL